MTTFFVRHLVFVYAITTCQSVYILFMTPIIKVVVHIHLLWQKFSYTKTYTIVTANWISFKCSLYVWVGIEVVGWIRPEQTSDFKKGEISCTGFHEKNLPVQKRKKEMAVSQCGELWCYEMSKTNASSGFST